MTSTALPAPQVTVVIPTFRRPFDLLRAMHSVFRQTYLDGASAHLIIVDNDPYGSSLRPATNFGHEAPHTLSVLVLHCPEPGVANARNMALDAVTTPLVAFLDDDQSAPDTWLAELVKARANTAAAVVFGPVDTALPGNVTEHRDHLQAFFSRNPNLPDGLIPTFFGCGNSLLDLGQLPRRRPLFDARTNETGGEDDHLFGEVQSLKGRFAWASQARVWEHVPASRATLAYTMRRAVAYGQGPSRQAREGGDYGQLVFWMAVGTGQLAVFGTISVLASALRLRRRAIWYNRAAQGYGKLIWWPKHLFYGASQTVATPLPEPANDLVSDEAAPLPPQPLAS